MMKKYLMGGMAAIALCTSFTSFSKGGDVYEAGAIEEQKSEQKSNNFADNFEKVIGGKINSSQDWNLYTNYSASIKVNAGFAQNYTLGIYTENPLFNKEANCLAIANVKEGETANMSFTGGKDLASLFVGVYDEKGHGIANSVNVENGKLIANIGNSKAATRATEAEWPTFAKTMSNYLSWTIDEMKQWTALTNEALTDPTNGNHTLNDLQYVGTETHWIGNGDGHHYRIPAGTTVTESFSVGDGTELDNVVVYVEGKAVITPSNNLNAITLVVANGGEIELKGVNNMSTSGRFVVAKGGKITGEDGAVLSINNAGACFNGGEINFNGTLRINGSDFYNNGTINVDILTGTSGGTTVTNFGKIKARTNAMAGETYNGKYTNACYLQFTEDAGIGQLTLLNNSRIDVGGKLQTSGTIKMYTLSEICCKDLQVQMTSFEGPAGTDDYAVVKVTNDLWAGWGGDLSASGNLYFDWAKMNSGLYVNSTWSDLDNQNSVLGIIKANMAKFMNEETAPDTFTIPAGDCTGAGYNPDGNPGDEIPSTSYTSIAFEDLGSTDDFDFNDIVLYVEKPANSDNATVKCVAQGGTLQVDVNYDGRTLFSHTDGQMHTAKGNYGTESITFTGVADARKFSITVKDGETSTVVSSAAVTGSAPQALIIPGQWAWPTERTNITVAYPDFATWVKDVTNNDWYTNPTTESGKIVR